MPRDRAAPRERARAWRCAMEAHVPVALRRGGVAPALYAADPRGPRPRRDPARRRRLPGLRLGLPRDTGGARNRSVAGFSRGRRTRAAARALPERIAGVDRRAPLDRSVLKSTGSGP